MAERRVLMIAPNFPPVSSAGVFRTLRFTKYLPDCGWQPIVLSRLPAPSQTGRSLPVPPAVIVRRIGGQPATPNGRQPLSAIEVNGSRTSRNSLPVRAISPFYRMFRNFWQLANETPDKHRKWARIAFPVALEMVAEYHPEVVYTSGPPHSVHLLALRLKRQTDLPWVADFRDPWARSPWGGKPRNPWGQRLLHRFERACVTAADHVVLNTPRMAEDFREAYPQFAHKFSSIPNGWDPDVAEMVDTLQAAPRHSRSDGMTVLCHAGTCYRQRDPRNLFCAIRILLESGAGVRMKQVGRCAPAMRLPAFLREKNLVNCVELLEEAPHEVALRHSSEADILVLLQPGAPLMVPGKLYEMLLFQTPILAICDEGDAADLVRRYKLGVVAPPQNPSAIAAAVRELMRDRASYARHAGWADARRAFDGRDLTKRLAAVLTNANELRTNPSATQDFAAPNLS